MSTRSHPERTSSRLCRLLFPTDGIGGNADVSSSLRLVDLPRHFEVVIPVRCIILPTTWNCHALHALNGGIVVLPAFSGRRKCLLGRQGGSGRDMTSCNITGDVNLS